MKQEIIKNLIKIAKTQQLLLKKLAKESRIDLKFKTLCHSIIHRSQTHLQ
jgi:hypothetical protein